MKQPWIDSARVDGLFILAPAFFVSALILAFAKPLSAVENIPLWVWGVLILGVDVAHVYGTFFRTYADPHEFRARRALYIFLPLGCWVTGTFLYSLNALWFWRFIAYLAVFHFMRQQYGFMMLYGRHERGHGRLFRALDKGAIYAATLYPLLFWHTHAPRHFDWFVEGDFLTFPLPWLDYAGFVAYLAVFIAYAAKEAWLLGTGNAFNKPRNLLLAGTALSWWVSIVAFDNDLIFTAANVLAHGVPYMALIWIYGRNQGAALPERRLFGRVKYARFFTPRYVLPFLACLVLLAYLEEGVWDGLIWTEHRQLFAPFRFLPVIDAGTTLAWLVPLLALPQLTHYALDAFIWRMQDNPEWKRVLFHRESRSA